MMRIYSLCRYVYAANSGTALLTKFSYLQVRGPEFGTVSRGGSAAKYANFDATLTDAVFKSSHITTDNLTITGNCGAFLTPILFCTFPIFQPLK